MINGEPLCRFSLAILVKFPAPYWFVAGQLLLRVRFNRLLSIARKNKNSKEAAMERTVLLYAVGYR